MELPPFGTSNIIFFAFYDLRVAFLGVMTMVTANFFFQTSTESEPEGDIAVSQDQENFAEKAGDEGIFCRPLFLLCFLYTS